MWKHCVVRARTPIEPFNEFQSASWFWRQLGRLYPETLSAVLMPNHIHLILPAESEGRLSRLRGLLGVVSKIQGIQNLWQPIPPASTIPDRLHLRRTVRYVALNPCRKKLCEDPLEWYWSTHRELVGATAHRIGDVSRLAAAMGERVVGFEVRHHTYVSEDPTVRVIGVRFPRAAVPQNRAEKSITEILNAAAATLRVKPKEIMKRGNPLRSLFVHMAIRHRWRQTSLLAEICGASPRAVKYILERYPPPAEWVRAADLCLGDPRLTRAPHAACFQKSETGSVGSWG